MCKEFKKKKVNSAAELLCLSVCTGTRFNRECVASLLILCFGEMRVVALTQKGKCFSEESGSGRRAHIPCSTWGRPSCRSHTAPESARRLPGFCLRAEPRALDLLFLRSAGQLGWGNWGSGQIWGFGPRIIKHTDLDARKDFRHQEPGSLLLERKRPLGLGVPWGLNVEPGISLRFEPLDGLSPTKSQEDITDGAADPSPSLLDLTLLTPGP